MTIRALLAAAALVLGGVLLPTATASALTLEVTCLGTETVAYQPGLLLTPQTVNVTLNGVLAPCTSTDPTITAGTYQLTVTSSVSCATLLDGAPATRIFHWSNGESSTFTYNRALNIVGGQATVTLTGTIVNGRFAGATAIQQVVFITPNILQCLTPPGLTHLSPGPTVLTITSA